MKTENPRWLWTGLNDLQALLSSDIPRFCDSTCVLNQHSLKDSFSLEGLKWIIITLRGEESEEPTTFSPSLSYLARWYPREHKHIPAWTMAAQSCPSLVWGLLGCFLLPRDHILPSPEPSPPKALTCLDYHDLQFGLVESAGSAQMMPWMS